MMTDQTLKRRYFCRLCTGIIRQEGMSRSFRMRKREKIEIVADVILSLRDSEDGLTWAKDGWRVKYLMDNCEVYEGLRAIERLEKELYSDPGASAKYRSAAREVRDAIMRELYNDATSLFRWAKFEDATYEEADLKAWFPGTVHIVWAHLFSVVSPRTQITRIQMNAMNYSWNGFSHPDWTRGIVDIQGFTWPSAGYPELRAGDLERARAQADVILRSKLPDFPYPFTAEEGGWLLRTLVALGRQAAP